MSGAGERESRSEGSSRDCQGILRVEAAMPRTARAGRGSATLHRTTVRRADPTEGTVEAFTRARGPVADVRARTIRKPDPSHRDRHKPRQSETRLVRLHF